MPALGDLPESMSFQEEDDGEAEMEIDDVVASAWRPTHVAPSMRQIRRAAGGGFGGVNRRYGAQHQLQHHPTMQNSVHRSPHAHVPSDIDSQISLPRSYTLPREFKYSKKPKTRKVVRPEMFASTNSSDGEKRQLLQTLEELFNNHVTFC